MLNFFSAALERKQIAPLHALSAELGSLSLEFTRLSQLTGDPKYFDAIQRITDQFEKHQNDTSIPGLFPIQINPREESFTSDRTFTFGGMSDSLYEYFPKMHLLLGGMVTQYQHLYERAIDAAKRHLFFRPMTIDNQDILISGTVTVSSASNSIMLQPQGQHLTCFAGGMVGIGAKIFNRSDELDIARKLVDGCIWAYDSMPTGIMPETFEVVPCANPDVCPWNTEKWHEAVRDNALYRDEDAQTLIEEAALPPGYTKIEDKRFLLRYTPPLVFFSHSTILVGKV